MVTFIHEINWLYWLGYLSRRASTMIYFFDDRGMKFVTFFFHSSLVFGNLSSKVVHQNELLCS